MYPLKRNRRLRSKKSLRNLVRETTIHPHDFIVPLFLVEGKNIKDEIPSMPNYYRFSLDNISKEVKQLWRFRCSSSSPICKSTRKPKR